MNAIPTPRTPARRFSEQRLALFAIIVVWIAAVLGGGSSRPDVLLVMGVRVLAVIGGAALLFAAPRDRLWSAPVAFACLFALLIALQLMPLPHFLWTALPGRGFYDQLAIVPEVGRQWRPISLAPDLTWNALLAVLPPLFFLLAVPMLDAGQRRWLMLGLLATICASGLLGILQVAGGPESSLRWYEFTNVESGVGFFANRNHQAVFLAMGVPLAIWWGSTTKRVRQPLARLAIAGLVVVFLLAAVTVTQSRMGLLVAVVAALFAGLFLLRNAGMRHPAIAGAVVAVLLAVPVGLAWFGQVSTRFAQASIEDDLRVRILPETMQAVWTFFPFGAGAGTFPEVFRRFESIGDLAPTYPNHTHNDLTEILFETGIFGPLLLAVLLFWFLRSVWRIVRAGRDAPVLPAQVAAMVMVLPAIASLSDYPLRTPLMASAFAILAAVLHKTLRESARSRR